MRVVVVVVTATPAGVRGLLDTMVVHRREETP
jgi:hypothetical protein